jgi:glycosyltransferase involved in cell wall biosynthesis
MNKPLLSVCLLTYNQAPYVKEAIDTILVQEVNFAWELIIADDYSTDGTREILLEYKKQHPDLIKLILQNKNKGPEGNWLDLMEYPKSKYVLYTEGDDYFSDPTKLQRQVDFLETHHSFSICFHPVKVIYEDGSRPDEIFPTPKQRFNKDVLELKDLLMNNFIQTNSAMYQWRFTHKNIKDIFPKNISPGDWFLHILHADVGKVGFINRTMSVYRKHPGGLWWDANNNKDEFWKKYGLSWLNFYIELIKIYGSNSEYRKITDSSTINLLNTLIKVDEEHHNGLFNNAISSFPEAAEIYINNLHQQLSDLLDHANKQAKIIKHYLDLNQTLEAKIKQLENENRHLWTNLLVRLGGAIKNRTRKNQK